MIYPSVHCIIRGHGEKCGGEVRWHVCTELSQFLDIDHGDGMLRFLLVELKLDAKVTINDPLQIS